MTSPAPQRKHDPPQVTTLDLINTLQITLLTVAVVVLWFWHLCPRLDQMERSVKSAAESHSATVEEVIKRMEKGEWQRAMKSLPNQHLP